MTPRAPRADAQRNRAKILAAAGEAFAVDGPDVPLDAVAALAGVGAGTVHRHFPTKESLIAAVVAARLERLADRADQGFFGALAQRLEHGATELAVGAGDGDWHGVPPRI